MNDFHWSLRQIAESIPHNAITLHVATSFLRPHDNIWPDDPSQFTSLVDSVLEVLSSEQQRLFYSVCLASFLLNPLKASAQFKNWFLDKSNIISLLGIDVPFEQFQNCQWSRVAIPLADPSEGSKEQMVYALVAKLETTLQIPCFPSWIQAVLNTDAQNAVRIAAELINKRYPGNSFFFWPMVKPFSVCCTVNGSSLGLPTYLTFYSLAQGENPPQIVATGTINSNGDLKPVSFVDKKIDLAIKKGFQLFIHPVPSLKKSYDAIEIIELSTLRDAEIIWTQHSPGAGREISAFIALMDAPAKLVAHLPDIPSALIPIDKELHCQLKGILNTALSEVVIDVNPFDSCMTSLSKKLDDPSWDKKFISSVLDLFTMEIAERLVILLPVIGFKLAQLKIRYSNHCGDTVLCGEWFHIAQKAFNAKRHLDSDDRDQLLLLVNSMIGTLHNNYEFNPVLPTDLQHAIDDVLEDLESNYTRRKKKEPNAVNNTLGSYYGSIAQNYGFCGPEYLNKVEEYTEKAREAFGNCMVSDNVMKNHCLRQFCYLCYAYLDAGDFIKAEDALSKYLMVERFEDFQFDSDSNPFKHALLARFLADTGRVFSKYAEWAISNPFIQDRHPWQLWLFNMGRIEQNKERKIDYWQRSVYMCTNSQGETIRRMSCLGEAALVEGSFLGIMSENRKHFVFMYR